MNGLDIQVFEGDMRDRVALERALAGVRYVFHVAADYRLWARNPADIINANVNGTNAVMLAALAQGVERIVYTSSVATLRVDRKTVAADETLPLAPHEGIGAYKRSKILAERLVETLVATAGLPAVIVNPSTPIGTHDRRPTPTGRIIVEAANGRMPAFVDTGLNVVGVEDVAAGHLLALHRGRIGERYILGGDNVSLQRILVEIAELTGRRAPRIKLPLWPLYPLAGIAEILAQATGKEPFVTIDGLRMSKSRMYFTSSKAETELGYRPKPYSSSLQSALAWFDVNGYLR